MSIVKLMAILGLDGSRFKAGLKEAEVAAGKFGKSVTGAISAQFASVFGGAALVAFALDAMKTVGALKDMAEQSHMTTDEVQRFSAAAKDIGLNFTDIAAAEKQFNEKRKDAVEHNMELRETFAKYGMTLEDLQNPQLKFADFLLKANVAMRGMTPEQMTRGLNDMAELMGARVGPKLQELIKNLETLQDMPIVDKATIDRVDEAGDSLERMKTIIQGRLAIFASDTFKNENWMSKFGHGGAIRFWKTMFGGGDGSNAPSIADLRRSDDSNTGGPNLFDDTAEKKQAVKSRAEFQKAKAELERAMLGFGLSKEDALEARMREAMDFIGEAEDGAGGMTTASAGARKDLIGLLNQVQGKQMATPGVSSLTGVGQMGGRQFINDRSESEIVKAAKALLKPTENIEKEITDMNRKVKPGKTIGGSL